MGVRQILFFFLCLISIVSAAQDASEDDYASDNVLKYDDYVYKPNIRTVLFHDISWEYAAPIISLKRNELVELSFDDLDVDPKRYYITFLLCNADWTPSDLMQSEYLNGYNELEIRNYDYSKNTFQKYTHYSIIFPQQGIQFTKSGNYLMYVYLDGDRSNLVLSRRLMVYDDRVNIAATFHKQIGGGQQDERQQLDFSITPTNYNLNNPNRDVKIAIMQNNRWDNAVTDVKPTFIQGQKLIYSLDEGTSFPGGNEFRYFDIRSLRFLTERVKDIYRDENMKYHVTLQPDENWAKRPYLFHNDINGAFEIRNTENAYNMDTEADYGYVHFFLPYPVPVSKGNFYVMGKLTDWRMNKLSKMKYNYTLLGYEATLYLKQGYYNYMYVLSEDGKKGGDATVTEGSHWDTENNYTIFVYHRQFGTYYDQLIGYKRLNSLKN